MRLLEFESKQILQGYKIPTPRGQVIEPGQEPDLALPVVLKAQVPMGGRGKAGGILAAPSPPSCPRVWPRFGPSRCTATPPPASWWRSS